MKISVFELKCLTNVVLNTNHKLTFQGASVINRIQDDYTAIQLRHSTSDEDVSSSEIININLGKEGLKYAAKKFDIGEKTSLKVVVEHIKSCPQNFLYLLEWPPVSFIPLQDTCCSLTLTLSDGREAKLFCKEGSFQCKTFEATCTKCKVQYGHGYKEIIHEDQRRRFYQRDRFFLLRKGSVFDDIFFREVVNIVVLSRSKFSQIADIYNRPHKKEDSLDPDILSDTFIVWNIVRRLECGFLIKRVSETNRHLDVEALCTEVIAPLVNTFRVWIYHRCEEPGCKERMAIVDGNFVNRRKICAAPGNKIIASHKSELNVYEKCIKNPLRGKKNFFCEDHENEGAAETVEQQDLRPETRQWAKEMEQKGLLPKVDDIDEFGVEEECRKKENINVVPPAKEKKRGMSTAGIMLWVRPCLIKVHLSEIYHAESLTQWTTSMIDTFGLYPRKRDIKWVCGDRACGFCPFLEKRAAAGNDVIKRYLKVIKGFPLDKFHAKGHKQPQCLDHGDAAKFHPSLQRFSALKGTNWEAAEQSFRSLNEFSGSLNYMTYGKRIVLITVINDEFNAIREDQLNVIDSGKEKQDWRQEDELIKERSKEWKKELVRLLK